MQKSALFQDQKERSRATPLAKALLRKWKRQES